MSQDPVVRSDALDAQLAENPVITNLVLLAQQHGRIIRILIALMVLIALLSLGLGYATWKALSASHAAKVASSQTHVNCLAANQARTSQRQLWTFILSFPPPAQETARARQERLKETKKFRAYVQKQFAPLNCAVPAVASTQDLPKVTPLTTHPQTPFADSPTVGPVAHSAGGSNSTSGSRPHPSATPSQSPSSPRPSPSRSPSPSPSHLICLPLVKCIGLGSWSLWL